MGRDGLRPEPVAQVPRNPFRHPARVDEDERGAMRPDEVGEPLVVLLPHLVRHDRFERRLRQLQAEVHLPAVALVDDLDVVTRSADEKSRDLINRLLSCRQADSLKRLPGGLLQPLERQREVGAAAPADHRMDFVDDHRPDGAQHLAAALGGEQEIKRLGCGDQDVRRLPQHRRALVLRRVAGPDSGRYRRGAQPARLGPAPQAAARLREILVDVGAQRLQRRDVDDPDRVGEWCGQRVLQQAVESDQKRGERLARSGRGRDQGVTPLTNRRPAAALRHRRLAERFSEPLGRNRMKGVKGHGKIRVSHIPCIACGA